MKAVILAGGKGTRLKPYTLIFPKPLVPVDEKPILEIVIRQLSSYGVSEIIMCVGHLAELIMAYFGDGSKYGVKIKYSREEKPLGTIGPLKLIKGLNAPFFVLNGDILCSINFRELYDYHIKNPALATVAITERKVQIDFGVIETKGNELIKHIEKPVIPYFVGMGICVFEPEIVDFIPENTHFDAPDLIRKLLGNSKKINAFKFDGYWLDIGRHNDYETANEEFKKKKDLLLPRGKL